MSPDHPKLLLGRAVGARNWQGRVHSVFRRAVNLAVDGGLFTLVAEADWISESSAQAGPSLVAGAGRDSVFSFRDGLLYLDGRAVEDYRRAEVWRMPDPCRPVRTGRLRRLGRELAARPAQPLCAQVEKIFLEQATAFARRREADFMAVIGAGPGLTPAGDDMLCGFALALACLTPARLPELDAACAALLERTTDVSRHLLREALRGSFGRPLLGLLLAVQDRVDFAPALQLALSIGAGSGRDGAFGLYHGLRLVQGQQAQAGPAASIPPPGRSETKPQLALKNTSCSCSASPWPWR